MTEQVRELTGKLAALPEEEQERYAATFLKELEWFWIGPHDEYERILANL